MSPLESLPDSSRLWIYALDRPLEQHEYAPLQQRMEAFIANWQSHGRPVLSGYTILHDRFVVIAGVIPGGEISGCGIDASVHALNACGEALGFTLLSGLEVCFRDEEGRITHLPRPAFRKLARTGAITGNFIVFDTSLTVLEDLRRGRFELPASASWHGRVFKIPAPAHKNDL